ncbi:gamma-glutamylcyclotransferase [Gramella jeungdoensis]|uniref:Gamma-glutamylcyclotransferase n=1 Tax=Gramella jeungdoensis TaxID=708091 RepID=A0ABT0Z161_9FLAO|nr:gamma-glutamylcyclotransferase family protein [Gramella jeungdoensis]MCM8569456.1 gamma-glutamylcyclotransferase [Gramella jeungdoensis]
MEHLFVYGTLQDKRIQQKLFGRSVDGKDDLLSGYEKYRIRIPDNPSGIFYPAIKSSADQKNIVQGTLLQLDREELIKADRYEGNSYLRKKLNLESGITAWVYVAKS